MLKKIFLSIYLFLLLWFFQTTFAEIIVNTNISTNITWSANTYVIEGNISLLSWSTLTVQPWTVIKFWTWASLSIWWKLLANWVIFTSYHDNSAWQALWSGIPVKWSWLRMRFSWVWSNGSELNNSEIRYWGYAWMPMIYTSSNLKINNSIISHSKYDGVTIAWWNSTIENTTFRNNDTNWLNLWGWTYILRNNTFSNNTTNWITITAWTHTVENSIFTSNWTYWIYQPGGTIIYSWNTITNNGKILYSNSVDLLLQGNTTISWNIINAAEISNSAMSVSTWTITSNGWWFDIVAVGNWTLVPWKTMSIEPWTVIKVKPGILMSINGNLKSIWTSWEKIVFTSYDDNSVWQPLGTGTPAKWSWWRIRFSWVWSNDNEFTYTELRYWWYAWMPMIYTERNLKISNSIISHSKYDGIMIAWWNSTIENTILYKNNLYWINKTWWTPILQYNLYYLNTSWPSNITLTTTEIEADPLFVDEIDYKLQTTSPAINAWNPSYWNHPISWDRYDIWTNEYMWFLTLDYRASITWTNWRNLTYEWEFIESPVWTNIVFLSSSTWILSTDKTVETKVYLNKIGTYKIKLTIKEWENILKTKTSNFTVYN